MDGISLGPLLLRWNGLLVMLGFAAGGILAARESRRLGHDPEILLDLVLPLLIWGTIGARLWHVLAPPLSSLQLGLTTEHYLAHPLDLIAVWIGGLGFPGALLGGCFGLYAFCRKHRLLFPEWADLLAPAVALGQAVGRVGNYINQELYGLPTDLPWKIYIDPEHRLEGFESVEYYHPLFAYEGLPILMVVILLLWISRKYRAGCRSGDLFMMYLLSTAGIRFFLEFLRLDRALYGQVNINQVFMGIVLLACLVFFFLRRYSWQKL